MFIKTNTNSSILSENKIRYVNSKKNLKRVSVAHVFWK